MEKEKFLLVDSLPRNAGKAILDEEIETCFFSSSKGQPNATCGCLNFNKGFLKVCFSIL